MKQRRCIVYGCVGVMRPTRKMWDLNGEILNPTHRMFKCSECDDEKPWLDKPILNGTFGELHNLGGGCSSGLSLMSDPEMYPPKDPLLSRRRRRR